MLSCLHRKKAYCPQMRFKSRCFAIGWCKLYWSYSQHQMWRTFRCNLRRPWCWDAPPWNYNLTCLQCSKLGTSRISVCSNQLPSCPTVDVGCIWSEAVSTSSRLAVSATRVIKLLCSRRGLIKKECPAHPCFWWASGRQHHLDSYGLQALNAVRWLLDAQSSHLTAWKRRPF